MDIMNKFILIILFIVSIILVACSHKESYSCTADAMICPDGTAVGRNGHNCEFDKCPELNISKEVYCDADSDCDCGINLETRECFLGNKDYVNNSVQCPDFCSGLDGRMKIKC